MKDIEKRLEYIDKEIKEVIGLLNDTYSVYRQISLSKCLTMLYELKLEALKLK